MVASATPGTRFRTSSALIVMKFERYSVSKRGSVEVTATKSRMSTERFCTTTPVRLMSSGSRGSAICTRLFTWIVALLTSVPTSKVQVIVSVPFEEEVDWKYSRPSTPESCSSIGAATVRESVSALAPGSAAVIVTVGGAISGYCATGNTWKATSPASVMMIAMTDAKIGRSMKNRDMAALLCGRSRRGLGFRRSLRTHHGARPNLEQVVEYDPVAGVESGEDHPIAADPVAHLDRTGRGLVFLVEREHQKRFLGLDHRGLGHEEHVVAIARRHLDAHELARKQAHARIAKFRAQLLRGEPGVDLGRGKIEPALERVGRAVGECEAHLRGLDAIEPLVGELREIRPGKAEADPDRVHLIHRREQAAVLPRRHQAALGTGHASRDTRNRCGHPRIGEIELRLAQIRLGGLQRRVRELLRRDRIVEFFLADRFFFGEGLEPRGFAPRLLLARALLRHLRVGLGEGDLVGDGVDLEERGAFAREIPLVVEALEQDP